MKKYPKKAFAVRTGMKAGEEICKEHVDPVQSNILTSIAGYVCVPDYSGGYNCCKRK